MFMDIEARAAVQFDADAVKIGDTSHILLCASLFYFRIPRALWKERMAQLKAFGYNSIDVYFPWNYHETAEGKWDFSGERDVSEFLAAAAEAGLYVVARPGPYICSEWDGGALPAYLLTKELKLRDNDEGFLSYVAKWFDRILPLLKQYQAGEGGTVIGVQLDNELDFYDCHDPKGYISALRDMALSHGITVPLFACAGQGGILQASGLAENVVPTCNFYPDNRELDFEQKVLHYNGTLAGLGYPLLVTETNRAHYLLRRLLSCGAKLLGPYLQVSGTDFGFTNATNNWGKPLAFMTSDYDFGGMISPEGHIREEAYEGRLLSRLITAYGAPLAEAAAGNGLSTEWVLAGDRYRVAGPYALQLKGGGSLLFVTNLDERDKEVAMMAADEANAPAEGGFTLRAGRSLALPCQVPLSLWGFEGLLVSSTAELFLAEQSTEGANLVFHSEGKGVITLQLDSKAELKADHARAEWSEGRLTIAFDGEEDSCCSILMGDGRELKLFITDRMKALYIEGIDENGDIQLGGPFNYPDMPETAAGEWKLSVLDAGAGPMNVNPDNGRTILEQAGYLEQTGIYRGFAWYEAAVRLPEGKAVQGFIVRQGSDVVSLYADSQYAGTLTPGGGSAFIPFSKELHDGKLLARVEIWGHSNFDDARLPGLRLHAMKGLGGVSAITETRDLSRSWSVYRAADRALRKELVESPDDSMWPIVNFGGWMSPDHPAFEYYRKSFQASADASSWTLHFKGLQSLARLFIDGKEIGAVHPFDPYIDISGHVTAGEKVVLTVYVERVLGLPSGQVLLYEGHEAEGWTVSAAEEAELFEHAESEQTNASTKEFPILLAPGETAWLFTSTVNSEAGAGWRAKAAGTGLKLTVFLEGRIVGRIWLPSDANRPVLTGGSPDSFYLPGAWYEAGKGSLAIMLEAVDRERQGRLESIQFISV
ncbi:beta-galactosidase [Paenibacillus sp. LHD-38]|uniref:beta-galactosidase n=1 Tax=Paenibacillus sp. LHD-38 TaxID=3072143 RepID=UPI00280F9E22|nr:beta-galactosidase [Paenibacillus sp. LHD-38]MDQ8734320.1 beta-galactosidase [Paenibacillus sp. LHD-38]